jgi:hypothetical protein
MRSKWREWVLALLPATLALSVAGAPILVTSCTAQEGAGILNILTKTGECVEPIVVQGLLAGEPAGTIADAALACGGATLDGVLAYVESLLNPTDGGAALTQESIQRIAALHAELLNRKANAAHRRP